MGSSKSSLYFVLGTPGSGRREIVCDLVENGLEAGEPVLVIIADSEAVEPAEEKLAKRPGTRVVRAAWTAEHLPEIELPASGTVFLVADARADAITQIESLHPWMSLGGVELARIFTVVDCQFAERHPPLRAWFDACVHFSDVVFLTHRAGVDNKWVSEFQRHFETECCPSLFILVKKGGIPNPALVLEPQPRRVSQYFDETVDFSNLVIETDDDEEEGDDEASGLPQPEAYFERLRSGRRAKEVPDVTKFYEKQQARSE